MRNHGWTWSWTGSDIACAIYVVVMLFVAALI